MSGSTNPLQVILDQESLEKLGAKIVILLPPHLWKYFYWHYGQQTNFSMTFFLDDSL